MALIGIAALAAALRAIGLEQTFPGGGEVVLAFDDAQYHARRAWYSFLHFPDVLRFDAYLDFPKGAAVPWPPLYDLALAGAARVFGDTASAFEHTLAWVPVALGSATSVLVFVGARQVASVATAAGAGVLYAWLPVAIAYSRVGNPDHHAAVSFLAAGLLASSLAFFRPRASPARVWGAQASLVVFRMAMLLSWHGSLLYLVLTEAALVGAAVLGGRRQHLHALCAGELLCAAGIAPFAAAGASDVAGSLSPIELSLLHPALLVLFAWVAGAASLLERRRPGAPWQRKLLRALALGGVPAALAFVLPAAREGLAWAWGYAGREELWIAANFEAQPLFHGGVERAIEDFGYAAFALPLLPLAALGLARAAELRESAFVLAVWCALLCVVNFSNARYGNDFAAPASIAAAVGIAQVARALHARLPRLAVSAVAVLLGGVLLAPVAPTRLARARHSLRHLFGSSAAAKANLAPGLTRSIHEFAKRVRVATPETGGFDDLGSPPEYGVLCLPTMGFAVEYSARRPSPSDNFGPYLGPPGLELTSAFFTATDEQQAFAIAQQLRARYVVTTVFDRPQREMMIYRLHALDGTGRRGQPPLTHFRLVVDDPAIGVPLGSLSGITRRPVRNPFKLFEVVAGAVLEVAATPGSEVTARIEIETSTRRRFDYRVETSADEHGMARLRVPYSTSVTAPTRSTGPYSVTADGRTLRVEVDDEQVTTGATLRVR
jgi:hypothetical protein